MEILKFMRYKVKYEYIYIVWLNMYVLIEIYIIGGWKDKVNICVGGWIW